MDKLTKCTGEGCTLRYECHRFTHINFYENEEFFDEVPFDFHKETCEYIWNDNAEWLFLEIERLSKPTN